MRAKLSIITICYNDFEALKATIESIFCQVGESDDNAILQKVELIIVARLISKKDLETCINYYSTFKLKIILDEDNGLYNAMNIGLNNAIGDFVYFLNAGDVFYDRHSLSCIFKKFRPSTVSQFRVAQVLDTTKFVRPGLKHLTRGSFSHQGFIAPLTLETPMYDENLKISADSKWKKECLEIFESKNYSDIIAQFELGGISNKPSLKSVKIRFLSDGFFRGFLEAIKLLMICILGYKKYYNFVSNRKSYDIL